jgi:predicted PurR-regulated permease PerM
MLLILLNAISILILYILVFTLFYQMSDLTTRYENITDTQDVNTTQLKNLVSDINYNDKYLKKYVDHVHSMH